MGKRWSTKRLLAAEEALLSRLAGERDNEDDPEAPQTDDYEGALTVIHYLLIKQGYTGYEETEKLP